MPSQFGGVAIDETQSSQGGSRFGGIPFVEEQQTQPQMQGPPTADQMRQNIVKDQPWYVRALADVAMHPEDASIGGVLKNIGGVPDIKGGAENIGNAFSGIANPSPQTKEATDLVKKVQQGTATSGDYSGGILAEQNQSPPGQLLSAATKLFPPLGVGANLAGKAVEGISSATGIDPRNLQLGAEIGSVVAPGVIKAATSDFDIGKNAPGILGDTRSGVYKEPIPQASNVKSMASDSYNYADQQGGILHPTYVDKNIIDKATAQLPKSQDFMDFTGGKKNPSMEIAQMFENLRGKPLTLQGAAEIDQYLGNAAENEVNPATGKYTTEGNNIKKMQMSLRDAMKNAGEGDIVGGRTGFDAYQKAVPLWSTAMKMGQIERMIDNAQYADVPSTAIKNSFKTFLKNPVNTRGWDADEIAVAQNAAETGIVTGALKILGSKLMSGAVGTTAGALGGGPLGAVGGLAAGEAVGYPLRQMATSRQMSRGNAVLDKLASRAAVQNSLQEYSDAAANPTPQESPEPESPKQITYQPQPTVLSVNSAGQVYPQTAMQQASGIMARRAAKVNGLTPDVVAAQLAPAARAKAEAIQRLSPQAPKLIGLPAPKPELISEDGIVREQLPQETESGIAARQRAEQLGVEPGTMKAQQDFATRAQETALKESPANIKTQSAFDKAEAEAATQKASDIQKFMNDNQEPIQDLIKNTVEKYKDAGIQPGQLGEALLRFLRDERGSVSIQGIGRILDGLASGKIPGLIVAGALATSPISQTTQQSIQPQQQIAPTTPVSSTAKPQSFNAKQSQGETAMMAAFRNAESGGNNNAKSKTSSAAGPYGFTLPTWTAMVKKYGQQTGIGLNDRMKPEAQVTMARLLAQDNINTLHNNLGRMPTKGELYAAHVLGPDGATRLINAVNNTPQKQAIMLFPRSVTAANQRLFFDKGNRPITVEALYQLLNKKVA